MKILLLTNTTTSLGFPGGASSKESICQCRRQETQVPSLGQEDPTPVFLPGESYGQRSLAGYSPWGHKESDATEVT